MDLKQKKVFCVKMQCRAKAAALLWIGMSRFLITLLQSHLIAGMLGGLANETTGNISGENTEGSGFGLN
jgi:hypothetical protein